MSTELALTWDEGKYSFQQKLGNFVQYFQVNLPTNSHGIPMQIVDPLLLAQHADLLSCETTDDIPDAVVSRAVLPIDFEDGVPILEGTPIWERFDGEHVDYYKLFKEYREMLYNTGSRAIAKLAAMYKIAGRNLNALAKVYHWQLRVRAYDLYKKMEYERRRRFEIEKLESRHARAADTMLEQAMAYLERHPEQLNPKIALQMVQLAVKVGRLSVGLNGEKPGSGDGPTGTNIHINQNLGGGVETSVSDDSQPKTPGNNPDMSQLQSILHILDKSGALAKAKSTVVEADYEVIDGDEVAI